MTNKIVTEILDQIYAEGYQPGTTQFDFIFRKRRVERCREMRGYSSCQPCPAYDNCEIVKAHLRDKAEMKYKHDLAKKALEKKKREEAQHPDPYGSPYPNQSGGLPDWQVYGGVATRGNPSTDANWGVPPGSQSQDLESEGGDGSGVPSAGQAGRVAPGGGDPTDGGTGGT